MSVLPGKCRAGELMGTRRGLEWMRLLHIDQLLTTHLVQIVVRRSAMYRILRLSNLAL